MSQLEHIALGPRAGQDRMRYRLTPNLLDSRYKLERKNARLLKSFGRLRGSRAFRTITVKNLYVA